MVFPNMICPNMVCPITDGTSMFIAHLKQPERKLVRENWFVKTGLPRVFCILPFFWLPVTAPANAPRSFTILCCSRYSAQFHSRLSKIQE